MTFLHRQHTNGQKAHEKILNITNYERNANQNHNDLSPHAGQNGHHKKNQQTMNAEEDLEKREPSYTVGKNVDWCSHSGEQYGGSLKKLI